MSFKVMSAITAEYGPQDGQDHRSSNNISGWDTPKGGKLKFEVIVPDGYPQPTFTIEHDRSNKDDHDWYKNISNNVIVDVNNGTADSGEAKVYIITTSSLQSGLDKKFKYSVTILTQAP